MTDDVIVLSGVAKTFRDFWGRPVAEALKGIDLAVPRGGVFGIIGPNGSGKSTTIKLVLGLLAPDRGTVRVFGRPPSDRAVRARLGYLPELSHLHPFLTARETVLHYAALSGLSRADAKRRADETLSLFGISHAADRAVGGFSKGMARRVAFAAALVAEPELLVLDEPTSGLDPIGMREVKKLLTDLASGGTTVLVTSHNLFDMQDVCDRVCVLYNGKTAGAVRVADVVEKAADKRHALEDYFAETTGAV